MTKQIKIAIVGLGNCASSLIQGLFYYKNIKNDDELVPGLMHNILGPYKISDMKLVAAFDIDKRKIGKDVSKAMFELPNCTKVFCKNIPYLGVKVKMGPVLDGVAPHMKDYPADKTFLVAKAKPADVLKALFTFHLSFQKKVFLENLKEDGFISTRQSLCQEGSRL